MDLNFKKIARFSRWSIFLIILFFLCRNVVNTLRKTDLDFVGKFFFRSSSYKDLDMETYILADEDIGKLFSHPQRQIMQPTEKELYNKNVSIVLMIKGDELNSGRMVFKYKNKFFWDKLDVCFDRRMEYDYDPNYNIYIISKGKMITNNKDVVPDPIRVKWVEFWYSGLMY